MLKLVFSLLLLVLSTYAFAQDAAILSQAEDTLLKEINFRRFLANEPDSIAFTIGRLKKSAVLTKIVEYLATNCARIQKLKYNFDKDDEVNFATRAERMKGFEFLAEPKNTYGYVFEIIGGDLEVTGKDGLLSIDPRKWLDAAPLADKPNTTGGWLRQVGPRSALLDSRAREIGVDIKRGKDKHLYFAVAVGRRYAEEATFLKEAKEFEEQLEKTKKAAEEKKK